MWDHFCYHLYQSGTYLPRVIRLCFTMWQQLYSRAGGAAWQHGSVEVALQMVRTRSTLLTHMSHGRRESVAAMASAIHNASREVSKYSEYFMRVDTFKIHSFVSC